jgi:predicted AAA+ superfamily ATPase
VRYLELLASVFLLKSIPAWSSGHTGRAIGTPKLPFGDRLRAVPLDALWRLAP